MIHHGDCIEVMAAMPEASVDAIVTDPPYGLEFMGKEWDKLDVGLPQENVWKGRRGQGGSKVSDDDSKPASRHHVAFGGGKAGFKRCTTCGKRAFSGSPCQCEEPTWVIEYPDGAPSSMVRMGRWHQQWATAALRVAKPGAYLLAFGGTRTVHRMTVALEDAGWIIRDMLVWGYASGFPKSRALLKPAWEPIVMARKPGPLRDLDIDGCRIGTHDDWPKTTKLSRYDPGSPAKASAAPKPPAPPGRWPANIVLTDPIFDGGIEGVVGGGEASYNPAGVFGRQQQDQTTDTAAPFAVRKAGDGIFGYGDTGTYSRFFLIPKASRSDREPVMPGMLEEQWFHQSGATSAEAQNDGIGLNKPKLRRNVHPTVKPIELMRHLVRLVTPPGGTVLDPFLGSGSTALAAEQEGRTWVGIEREAEYVRIAEARLAGVQRGMGLDVA